ncbi:hypothetical protein YC2023_057534 [Brassica napus]
MAKLESSKLKRPSVVFLQGQVAQLASSQPLPILHRSSWLPQSNPYKPFIGFDLEFLLLWMKIQRPALSL